MNYTIYIPRVYAAKPAASTAANEANKNTETTNDNSDDTSNKLQIGVGFKNGEATYTSGSNGTIFDQYIHDLYSFSLILGSSLSTLMIIWAGYKYLTSQGNSNTINDAKEIVIGSLLGLAILMLVGFLLNVLNAKNPL